MENLVGRHKEISVLEKLLFSHKAELLAIYGRRRIGKTFLINKFYKNKGLYFEMTGIKDGTMQQQLQAFMVCLRRAFPWLKVQKIPVDWLEAFDILQNVIFNYKKKDKIILFFDEFPWMETHKSDLVKSFEFLWNSALSKDPRIIAILCGSSVSWMLRKIINNKGGLYGRLTGRIRLRPFTLEEVEKYFSANKIYLDRKQIIEVYMSIGGVPKYLSYVEPGKSAAQIIQNLCFEPGGPLTTEFESLYETLFDDYQTHVKIIELLARSFSGLTLNKIIEQTDLSSGGNLSQALKELVASDFVQVIPFFGNKKRESRYRLMDEYSFFYLNWIRNAMYNYDEGLSSNYWIKQQSSNKFKTWSGYVFESICFRHIRQIIESLKLSVIAESASYWSYLPKGKLNEKGAQIDLIIDRSDQCMNLCEIKFLRSEYTLDQEKAEKLNQRREVFREQVNTRKTLFNTLITPYGAKSNKYYLSSIEQQLDLNALFIEEK